MHFISCVTLFTSFLATVNAGGNFLASCNTPELWHSGGVLVSHCSSSGPRTQKSIHWIKDCVANGNGNLRCGLK